MSLVEFQWHNEIAPLKNSNAMKCIAVLSVSATSQTVDLATLFGKPENGEFYTLRADGLKVYIAFGTLAGTISDTATGTDNTVGFPVPDGTDVRVKLTGGRENATGIATYVHYTILHYKGSATGVTGYLRIQRSSLQPTKGSEQFPAP